MKNISWIVMCVAALSACDYDNEEELFPESAECDVAGLTYDNGIGLILNTNCAISGCHDGSSGLTDYSNYAAVKVIADNGQMEQRVLIQKDMPPSDPLTTCELSQIEAWLADGAPEN